ncbi:MAG: triose-phosphate isomerase [Phycisphaerae bacterium]|nr:triose-phosphate isomerase [Phycisphaerae bacterium]HAW96875.1 triose-phosphate isomerase [Phycisphaerales bacterium]
MSTRIPFVGGNWKMNTNLVGGVELAQALVSQLASIESGCEILICPPFPYLQSVGQVLKGRGVLLGAQNCSDEPGGAFTGQVSAAMLADLGVEWVIIGHSECRHGLGESNELIGRKVLQARAEGLKTVVCCGETEEDRHAGRTHEIIENQLRAALVKATFDRSESLVVAYEPVWAIGTGMTPSIDDAENVNRTIRSLLVSLYDSQFASGVRVLYGGSMKPGNAASFIASPEIDGGLIGGASLSTDDFVAICRAVAGASQG